MSVRETAVEKTEETGCPECDGSLETDEQGETTCDVCGVVVDEQRLDHGQEWRTYDDDANSRSRVGSPRNPTRHDDGLSTDIGMTEDSTSLRWRRMRTLNKRANRSSKRARTEMRCMQEIRRIAGRLDLSETIIVDACVIARTDHDCELGWMGRSTESISAAALYSACRIRSRPVRPARLAEASGHEDTTTSRVVKLFHELVREQDLDIQILTGADHVPRICSEVGVPDSIRRRATEIAVQAPGEGIFKSPTVVAAAAVRSAQLERRGRRSEISQREIADAVDRSSVSVRSCVEDFVQNGLSDCCPPSEVRGGGGDE